MVLENEAILGEMQASSFGLNTSVLPEMLVGSGMVTTDSNFVAYGSMTRNPGNQRSFCKTSFSQGQWTSTACGNSSWMKSARKFSMVSISWQKIASEHSHFRTQSSRVLVDSLQILDLGDRLRIRTS